jgi:hypothetical protein
MSYLELQILKKAESSFAENPEAKRLAVLDILTDLAWEMSTVKKIIATIKEDIVNYSYGTFEHYVKIRKKALIEREAELKKLQESFNEALQILNKKS